MPQPDTTHSPAHGHAAIATVSVRGVIYPSTAMFSRRLLALALLAAVLLLFTAGTANAQDLPLAVASTQEQQARSALQASQDLPLVVASTQEQQAQSALQASQDLPLAVASTQEQQAQSALQASQELPSSQVSQELQLLQSLQGDRSGGDWEQLLTELMDVEDIGSTEWDYYYETLCDLEAAPLNINTATHDDWERIPFLTAQEIDDIERYLYNNHQMQSLGELLMIESLDYLKRTLLLHFVYCGPPRQPLFPSLKNIAKYGKHDLLLTGKLPCYTRKGELSAYACDKYKHSVKYTFTYGKRLKMGFVGAQDSGEPFFAGKNTAGYDFYSFYLLANNIGRIQTLALGKYRLRFGMGLVINNNLGFGKTSVLSSLGRNTGTITAHSSRSSANYLQGAATTIRLAHGLALSLFASYRKLDATLNSDSTIATIVTSGYHRTATELAKKNNSSQTVGGGNINYRFKAFHLGATALYATLSRELSPVWATTSTFYRRYYAAGKQFYNLSLDYGYNSRRLSFHGETATGDCGAVATVNMLSYSPASRLDLIAIQRFYSYRYYSLFSNSFAEGGGVRNESGVYLGMSWRPGYHTTVTAYSDFAYFPFCKYQVSQSSHSFDNMVQATHSPNRWTYSFRYRLKLREYDNDDKTALIYKATHRTRLSAAYKGTRFACKTQADAAYVSYKTTSFGWMVTQNASLMLRRLTLIATIGYFDTDDYSSCLYAYERSMLGTYYCPSYYGNGIRYALFATYRLSRHLQLTAKAGTTNYFDRTTISSGYQTIYHSSATDIELQARVKL